MYGAVTVWELALAFALVGLGILVGAAMTERRLRDRGRLPFHPRLR
jgi:uncharacterized membrane protein YhaH (DUF805 family)